MCHHRLGPGAGRGRSCLCRSLRSSPARLLGAQATRSGTGPDPPWRYGCTPPGPAPQDRLCSSWARLLAPACTARPLPPALARSAPRTPRPCFHLNIYARDGFDCVPPKFIRRNPNPSASERDFICREGLYGDDQVKMRS